LLVVACAVIGFWISGVAIAQEEGGVGPDVADAVKPTDQEQPTELPPITVTGSQAEAQQYFAMVDAAQAALQSIRDSMNRAIGDIRTDYTQGGDQADGGQDGYQSKCSREGGGSQVTGAPVIIRSGNKVLSELDLSIGGEMPLMLSRSHSQSLTFAGAFGVSWASTLGGAVLGAIGGGIYGTYSAGNGASYALSAGAGMAVPTGGLSMISGGAAAVTATAMAASAQGHGFGQESSGFASATASGALFGAFGGPRGALIGGTAMAAGAATANAVGRYLNLMNSLYGNCGCGK
jgi:hypothetical protein